MPIINQIDIEIFLNNLLWQTPHDKQCDLCHGMHEILPFSIKDYQDQLEYHFCTWDCLRHYLS